MKKITFFLIVLVLLCDVRLKAVTLPEPSKDGNVKWYFLQSMRDGSSEPLFYTADGPYVCGCPRADISDYATFAKQLWCFETEDGVWYVITNRYDGRRLSVGMSSYGEALVMCNEPQARFKLRGLEAETGVDCFGLESHMSVPNGDSALRFPSVTDSNDNTYDIIRLVNEEHSTSFDCGIKIEEFNDVFNTKKGEDITWYNIVNAKSGVESGMLVDTKDGQQDGQSYFSIKGNDPFDQSAQWCILEDTPGTYSIINRATGKSIDYGYNEFNELDFGNDISEMANRFLRLGYFNVPYYYYYEEEAVSFPWHILPVGKNQYAISHESYKGSLLCAYAVGDIPEKMLETGLAGTDYAWKFMRTDEVLGIENVENSQDCKISVKDGRIVAPGGAEVTVFTPEGIELPSDSRLTPGVYIVTVNGKATKILVH